MHPKLFITLLNLDHSSLVVSFKIVQLKINYALL